MSTRRLWLLLFAGFSLLFLTTGHWYGTVSVDTQAADLEAYQLVHTGHLDLSGVRDLPDNPFLVRTEHGLVADRTVGVTLVGVPLQALLSPLHSGPDTGGVATAALLVAAALATTALVLSDLGGSRGKAVACTVTLGLGTALWTVASSELWTHSAAALWLALMMRAAQRAQWWWAGLSGLLVTTTRVHLLLITTVLALAAAVASRSLKPAVLVGGGIAVGLGGLVLWNHAVFGHAGLAGGYYSQYVGLRFTEQRGILSTELEGFAGTFFSPLRGVLLYTPVALVGLVAAGRGWGRAPAWAGGAAAGGLLYLAVQLKLNGFYGGTAFFGNRLAIELLLVTAPLAYCGYLRAGAFSRHLARVLAALSIGVHATGALLAGAAANYQPTEGRGWHIWLLGDVLRETGAAGWTVLLVALVAALVVAYLPPMLARKRPSRPL